MTHTAFRENARKVSIATCIVIILWGCQSAVERGRNRHDLKSDEKSVEYSYDYKSLVDKMDIDAALATVSRDATVSRYFKNGMTREQAAVYAINFIVFGKDMLVFLLDNSEVDQDPSMPMFF